MMKPLVFQARPILQNHVALLHVVGIVSVRGKPEAVVLSKLYRFLHIIEPQVRVENRRRDILGYLLGP